MLLRTLCEYMAGYRVISTYILIDVIHRRHHYQRKRLFNNRKKEKREGRKLNLKHLHNFISDRTES
jgi:hypothetical protein